LLCGKPYSCFEKAGGGNTHFKKNKNTETREGGKISFVGDATGRGGTSRKSASKSMPGCMSSGSVSGGGRTLFRGLKKPPFWVFLKKTRGGKGKGASGMFLIRLGCHKRKPSCMGGPGRRFLFRGTHGSSGDESDQRVSRSHHASLRGYNCHHPTGCPGKGPGAKQKKRECKRCGEMGAGKKTDNRPCCSVPNPQTTKKPLPIC